MKMRRGFRLLFAIIIVTFVAGALLGYSVQPRACPTTAAVTTPPPTVVTTSASGVRFLQVVPHGPHNTSSVAPFPYCPRALHGTATYDVHDAPDNDSEERLMFWARVKPLFDPNGVPHLLSVNDPRVDTYISGNLIRNAHWEPEVAAAMRRALGGACGGRLVVDVGANVGYFSYIAALSGCRVVSIEAAASNVQRLRQTARRAAAGARGISWTVYHNAAAEVSGAAVRLYVAPNDARVNAGNHKARPTGGGERGYTLRLDDILDEDVHFLKLDVEGYEPRALAGAARLFTEHRVSAVVLELSHDVRDSGCDWQSMQRWFGEHGYDMRSMRTGDVIPARESWTNNIFFTKRGQ